MVFKLVRVDSTDPCKIKLPVGKHDIGRGKFLFENEYDNKVSRNHAELLVTDDEVTLTALHSNPCFYMKKQHKSVQVLNKDSCIVLGCGDKFGILPHIYWYELIFCSQLPEDAESAKDNKKEGESVEKEADNEDLSKEVNFEPNETKAQEGGQSSPSTLERDSPTQLYEWRKSPSHDCEEKAEDQDEKAQSPLKRPISPNNGDGEEIKKVKTDDDNADEAGPSNGASTSDDKDDNGPVRERCMYGASCYRKNLQHRAQYSHPADADWPAAERRACAFGAACRRRDPRHRRDCAHPPAPPPRDAPLQRDGRGRQFVERYGNIFYINAHTVNFYDDHFQVEDSDGDSVDYDYEF
ncbi:aprataxin and PNK-like factor isoform X2 [Manduca sexta]|uniref:aprataxin and PNK-like factor isoform X2 n=1 Tax=Manduca sexta TaxID=7130 RepID=UPI00188FDB16|nr:aprataxin and PNK-like factor isoform X2 [Manduca sexta]